MTTKPQRDVAVAVAGVALLVLLAGCAGGQTGGPQPSSVTSTPALPSPSASVHARSVPFGETFDFGDGVSIEVSAIGEYKLGEFQVIDSPDARPGDPYLRFEMTIANGSASDVGVVVTAEASYGSGSTEAHEVTLDEALGGMAYLPPKGTMPCPVAFLVPTDEHDDVVLAVNVTLDPKRTAVFSGAVSTSQ